MAGIFAGSTEITDVKVGSTDINSIYVGSTEVWTAFRYVGTTQLNATNASTTQVFDISSVASVGDYCVAFVGNCLTASSLSSAAGMSVLSPSDITGAELSAALYAGTLTGTSITLSQAANFSQYPMHCSVWVFKGATGATSTKSEDTITNTAMVYGSNSGANSGKFGIACGITSGTTATAVSNPESLTDFYTQRTAGSNRNILVGMGVDTSPTWAWTPSSMVYSPAIAEPYHCYTIEVY